MFVMLVTACDSQPQSVTPNDTSQIDEVLAATANILNARKVQCDDLLSTVQTSELSQTMWHSLNCPSFYTELAVREEGGADIVEEVPADQEPTNVQSGAIDFGVAPVNVSQ